MKIHLNVQLIVWTKLWYKICTIILRMVVIKISMNLFLELKLTKLSFLMLKYYKFWHDHHRLIEILMEAASALLYQKMIASFQRNLLAEK